MKCIIRIKELKMPSFCINKRITEAVKLCTVHEKCSSSMNLLPQWWGCLVFVAFVGSFPLCTKVSVLQVSGWRKNCKGRNHLCRWHFKLLFAAVLVQICFSKCCFKIGNTIVEMLKLLSSVFRGVCGLWKLLLHEWGEEIPPLQGRHLFENNCEFSKEINLC